jgi:hypothetical protein
MNRWCVCVFREPFLNDRKDLNSVPSAVYLSLGYYVKLAEKKPRLITGGHKQACLAPEQRTREAATAACQAALVQSPAASLAALANHRAAIDPAFAKTLAIVGDYACEPPPPLPRVRVLSGCSCLQSNDVIRVFILRPTLLIPLFVLSLCAVRVILAAPVSFQDKATPLHQAGRSVGMGRW